MKFTHTYNGYTINAGKITELDKYIASTYGFLVPRNTTISADQLANIIAGYYSYNDNQRNKVVVDYLRDI